MSRMAAGVKGVTLRDGDQVVGAAAITEDQEVLDVYKRQISRKVVRLDALFSKPKTSLLVTTAL